MAGRVKFYTDEHVPRAVVRGLRDRGVDVLSVAEAGMLGASDDAHLARGLGEGRVMLTRDEVFLRVYPRGAGCTGIVPSSPGMVALFR